MGKKEVMCPHIGKWRWVPAKQVSMWEWRNNLPRRVQCPYCNRRMKPDTNTQPDGDMMYRVPPHKRKGWWKKGGRRRK